MEIKNTWLIALSPFILVHFAAMLYTVVLQSQNVLKISDEKDLLYKIYFSNRPTFNYLAATHLPETAQYLQPQFGDKSKVFIKIVKTAQLAIKNVSKLAPFPGAP